MRNNNIARNRLERTRLSYVKTETGRLVSKMEEGRSTKEEHPAKVYALLSQEDIETLRIINDHLEKGDDVIVKNKGKAGKAVYVLKQERVV